MAYSNPAKALNGIRTSHICDRCNKRIKHGDTAGMYVTYYDAGGWTLRRTWCMDCCPDELNSETGEADEAILVGCSSPID